MGTPSRAVLATGICALLLTPPAALLAAGLPEPSSALLWATVDVCNTPAHPNTIGIRGSMPGTADVHELMFMRFSVEYRSAGGHWHYLTASGQSKWVLVGNGASVARQAGQDFVIAPNAASTYVLRGVIAFRWRLHGRTVALAVRATRAGHTAAAGADPPGSSAAICKIRRKAAGRS